MLYNMHRDVIQTHIGIGGLHAIAIFFYQAIVSFNGCSQWFEFFIDG